MEKLSENIAELHQSRRTFFQRTGIVMLGGIAGANLLGAASCKKDEDEGDVTPPEDLMREHGILNRVLLVYDHFLQLLTANQAINPQWITDAAGIIKTFIEDYHEKQEEDFLFPRFEKAHKLTDLVGILRAQHQAGRVITARLLQMGAQAKIETDTDKQNLRNWLAAFIRMYRPHEAREDTILFPALHEILSKHEFDSMGEDFERREHQLFGKSGFETFVDKTAHLEQQLGLYDLAQFTPSAT